MSAYVSRVDIRMRLITKLVNASSYPRFSDKCRREQTASLLQRVAPHSQIPACLCGADKGCIRTIIASSLHTRAPHAVLSRSPDDHGMSPNAVFGKLFNSLEPYRPHLATRKPQSRMQSVVTNSRAGGRSAFAYRASTSGPMLHAAGEPHSTATAAS